MVLAPTVLEKPVPIPLAENSTIPAAEFTPELSLHSDREEKPYDSPPRLNALRGLMFSIGLKNLGKTREAEQLQAESPFVPISEPQTQLEPEPEPILRPEIDRTVIARTFTPFPEPVPVSQGGDDSARDPSAQRVRSGPGAGDRARDLRRVPDPSLQARSI